MKEVISQKGVFELTFLKTLVPFKVWHMPFQAIENKVNKLISLNIESIKQFNNFKQIKTQKQSIEVLGNYVEKQSWW